MHRKSKHTYYLNVKDCKSMRFIVNQFPKPRKPLRISEFLTSLWPTSVKHKRPQNVAQPVLLLANYTSWQKHWCLSRGKLEQSPASFSVIPGFYFWHQSLSFWAHSVVPVPDPSSLPPWPFSFAVFYLCSALTDLCHRCKHAPLPWEWELWKIKYYPGISDSWACFVV